MELAGEDKTSCSITEPSLPHFSHPDAGNVAGLGEQDNGTSRTDGISALYQIMYQHRLPAFSYFRTTPRHP
ncbi:hypothetical protein Q8A67_024174 [Cirrhinus molitorella]|uniref:Uncharacterized protein n=1 Tax=Cirrhinus molitorella TaxID=172907 RepID=A0AA88NY25_9TELE|nr:hypothetical protein Q8A67_024174 [Cirrhinus molitorella]